LERRCWANETAVLLETKVSNDIPFNEYFEHYGPLYQLHNPMQSKIHNQNTVQYLNQVKEHAMEHLRHLECAPSVQMHQVPAAFFKEDIIGYFAKERALEKEMALHFKLGLLTLIYRLSDSYRSQLKTQ
jgi:hypothetical protein